MNYLDHLNEVLTDSLSEEQAIDRYSYLAKPATIRHYHRNHMLGDLIKRKDPTLYNVGKNEFEANNRKK